MASHLLQGKRKSFVSQSALSEILKALPSEDDVDGTTPGLSRPSLKRARDKATNVETPYGSLRGCINDTVVESGKQVTIFYTDPAACLWEACNRCQGFASYLNQCREQRPCSPTSPYDIVLYCDEVSPGNQLKPSNDRKLQVIYWSLKQLGGMALSKEDSWFVLAVVRSVDVQRMADGMAQVMKHMFALFLGERGQTLLNGILLPMPDGKVWPLCSKLRASAS